MTRLYPSMDALQSSIYSPMTSPTPRQARPDLMVAYSVVDDAKNKAQKLSAEASKEFEKASSEAQAKAGTIELYSGKYYAACTFGGLLACVSHTTLPLYTLFNRQLLDHANTPRASLTRP